MQPEYSIIEHIDSRRSRFTPEARAAHAKGLPFVTHQYVRNWPRDVELKRAERARKRAAKQAVTSTP